MGFGRLYTLTGHNMRFCGGVIRMGSRNNYGCAFFDETVLLGVVLLIAGPGFLFLLYRFSQVNDAFRLRPEFIWVFSVKCSVTGERTDLNFIDLWQSCSDSYILFSVRK